MSIPCFPISRLYLYDKIRDHLPEDVREAWDDRREFEIQFGIGHCGQSDIINHDLQACLDEHGMMPVGHHDVREYTPPSYCSIATMFFIESQSLPHMVFITCHVLHLIWPCR